MGKPGILTIEGAELIFRNFEGKEGKYNAAGDRNFCVVLEPELAETLIRDGWNVKNLKAKEEGDEDRPYLPVSVSFKSRGTNIFLIGLRGKTLLDEESAATVDDIEIETADIIVNPYEWNVGDKSGIKAYLRTAYITIRQTELDLKYADIPDASEWVPPNLEEP